MADLVVATVELEVLDPGPLFARVATVELEVLDPGPLFLRPATVVLEVLTVNPTVTRLQRGFGVVAN